jgi:hypothetical protein
MASAVLDVKEVFAETYIRRGDEATDALTEEVAE